MKGPVSILSAAVLFALAGSTADATQVARSKSFHSSTPPVRPASKHRRAPAGGILYDQTGGMTGNGFTANSYPASMSYSAQGADDFVVPTGQTWVINGFEIPFSPGGSSSVPSSANIGVWSDDGAGHPGATLLCDGTGTPGSTASSVGSFTLTTPCVLPEGSYWFTFQFANALFPTSFAFWKVNGPIAGQPGQWENPGGGFTSVCNSWGDFATCFSTVPSSTIGGDWAFQIIGNASSPVACASSSPTCLTVGMALYNSSNPTECGTATTLSATAGDKINYCFTFTNNTSSSLDYHTLSDNIDGNIFTLLNQAVPGGGATYQYNYVATANNTGNFAHTATWTAQDVPPGYSVTSSVGSSSSNPNFIDISGSGTALSVSGSDSGAPVTMPFSFSLYGQTSNALQVCTNGYILFDNTTNSCGFLFSNLSLPTSAFSTPAIVPFWDDVGTGGTIYTGLAPLGDPFVIQYQSMDYFASSSFTPLLTFEVQLYQDGTVKFAYDTVSGSATHHNGISATIGLQQNTSFANQYSVSSSAISDFTTLTWTPTTPTVYSVQANYTVNVGAPVAAVTPTALSGSAASGDTTTATLDIGNTGNRDLIWSLDEAPGSSKPTNFPATPVHVTPPAHATGSTHLARGHIDAQKRANLLAAAHRHPPRHPAGVSSVPAYGETFASSGFAYVAFNAANPGTLQTINPAMSNYYFAGTFASNDFSTEYAVSYPGGNLDAIDTSTGLSQTIGNTGLGGDVSGIRWDPTTGNTYAMATSCAGSTLYTLDLSTGAVTMVGSTGQNDCIIDIAIDPQGNMYGVDIIANTLVAIDKSTGASQTIGSLGSIDVNYAEGMDIDQSTGILYFAGFDLNTFLGTMYTVDLTTGLATEVGLIGPNGVETDAMAIAVASGPCATPSDVPWLSEDITGGTVPGGGSTPVTVTMDATSLTGGTYAGNVCVTTNDLTQRHIAVPVTFTVSGGNDIIFQNGFDP